jgi:hypothetical protein
MAFDYVDFSHARFDYVGAFIDVTVSDCSSSAHCSTRTSGAHFAAATSTV